MEEIEKEKEIVNYPKPVTIEGTMTILNQLQNCICKIENKNGNGTGFFCSINKKIKVLITNNHVINEDIIKEKKSITISINDEKEYKKIELNNKNIYTNKEYDITIIEIDPEKEKINYYLELDEKVVEDNLNNKSVYILHYPKSLNGQKAAVSYGIMRNIADEYNIIHYCCTENGSSGSPIINLLNNKIIGIHKESVKNKNYNRGTLLKYPIKEYLNQFNNKLDNQINLTIKVSEADIGRNIYFLNNDIFLDNIKNKEDEDTFQYYNKYYNELLYKSKIEIFIYNKKYENIKYFQPKEIGEYKIKLKFKENITDTSLMFFACFNITNIDLSSFNTKNVTNMQQMFMGCDNLTNIDLSSFNTKNVTNMIMLFGCCYSLTNIDLSSFDTKNVTDMYGMFSRCKNLTNIDLSKFETKNVNNMASMFEKCHSLTSLDLSSFDTKNATDMEDMFLECFNLKTVKINNKSSNNLKKKLNEYKNIKIV